MDKPKKDIYKTLIVNRMVVFALTIAFIVATTIQSISIKNLKKDFLNTILCLDYNSEVIPVKWMQRDENIKVEIMNHLEMFSKYFYQFDAFNVDKQLEKALWLGDKSVEQVYIKRKNDGFYDQVKTLGSVHKIDDILPENIEIFGNKEPYAFRVKLFLSITQDEQTVRYSFEISGLIIFVNRNYPLNPHGMLITKFSETNKIKI